MDSETIRFDLPIKNFDDLRAECVIPRILVVVLVPENTDDWILQDDAQMCMRHCGYWISLANEEPRSNYSTARITIPKVNMFDCENLTSLMNQASTGAIQ